MATERIFVNPLHTRHLRERRPSEVVRRRVHTPTENSPYGGVQAWGRWFFVRRCDPTAATRQCGWTTCCPEELPRLAEQDRVDFVFQHGSGFSGTVTETFFDRGGHFQLARVALDEPIAGVDTMTCFSGDPTVKRVEDARATPEECACPQGTMVDPGGRGLDPLGDCWFGEPAATEQDVLYRLLCRSVLLAQRAIPCPPPVSEEQERERVLAALMQIDRMCRLLTSWSQELAARIDLPNPPNPGRAGLGRATALCLERRAWWELFASCWISRSRGLVDDPHLLTALFALAQGSSCHPDISEENGAPFLSICPLDSSAGQEACTCTLWNAHWGALYRAGAAYADTRPEEEVDNLEETLDLLCGFDRADAGERGGL
jgi:hypothetical protein